jgi:hypothetical protein
MHTLYIKQRDTELLIIHTYIYIYIYIYEEYKNDRNTELNYNRFIKSDKYIELVNHKDTSILRTKMLR